MSSPRNPRWGLMQPCRGSGDSSPGSPTRCRPQPRLLAGGCCLSPRAGPSSPGLHTHGWCGRVSLHFAEGFLTASFMSWVIFPVSGISCKSIHVSTEFVTLFGESGTFDNDPWPALRLSLGCCQRTRLGGKHAVLISCRSTRLWHSCREACPRHGRETMSPSSSSSSQAWHKVSNTSCS